MAGWLDGWALLAYIGCMGQRISRREEDIRMDGPKAGWRHARDVFGILDEVSGIKSKWQDVGLQARENRHMGRGRKK